MSGRFPGGVISKTTPVLDAPPTTGDFAGEGGSISGIFTLQEQAAFKKAGTWPSPILPRELYTWGRTQDGAHGLNVSGVNCLSSPVQVGSLSNWADVDSSFQFNVAIKTDGTLWTWGDNNDGQLGHNDKILRSSPVQVGALTNWYQASAQGSHIAALKTDGTLWTWGGSNAIGDGFLIARSSPVQIGALTNWSIVSSGAFFNVAVKTDGTLWSWGFGGAGRLGTGNVINRSSPVQIGALTNWTLVSANVYGALAITTSGELYAWGCNGSGRLGDSSIVNRSSPVQIGALTNWLKLGTSVEVNHAIKTDGTLWGWGANGFGQIGNLAFEVRNYSSSPVQVGVDTNWSHISSGGWAHSVGIKTDGTLWTWGCGDYGQLGNNLSGCVRVSCPIQIGSDTNWLKSTAGFAHTMAITKN